MKQYFVQTKRLGFSHWKNEDSDLPLFKLFDYNKLL